MNRSEFAVLVFSTLAALSPALAQNPAPDTRAGTPAAASPKEETRPATRSNREAAPEVDARACLEFATNNEIIKCAEKYRSRKRTG